MIVASVAGGVVAGVATADPADARVVAAPETWTPPQEVARTPVGGPPPDRARVPSGGEAPRAGGQVAPLTSTCTSDYAGILPWYTMERHEVSDRFEVLVNLYNRNVVLAYRELTVKGTGLNLSHGRFYNSENSNGTWLSSYAAIGLSHWSNGTILEGPNGYCVFFGLKSDGTFAPSNGLHAKLTKTPDGGYVVSFDSSGERWLFTASGWLVSQSDRNGNAINNRYNTDGTLASVTDTQGRVTTFAYDGQKRPKSITDPSGQTFGDYVYDGLGHLSEFTDRAGGRIKVTFADEYPYVPTSVTDGRGGVYRFEYDAQWHLTKLTEPTPDGAGASTTYTADGKVTDANGGTSTYEFDYARQTKATDALGHARAQTWTAAGDVNSTTNATQHSTTYQYDSGNNLIGTKLPTGAQNVVGYTSSAHPHLPTQITDGSGNQVTRQYDTNGNLTGVRSVGLGVDIGTYTYNRNGTVATRKDGKGAVTSYTYDGSGNLTKVTPPAPASPTSYSYDSLSRLTSVTDGNNVRIDYGYDRLDRVVSAKHGTTVVQANTHDANGNLTSTQVPGVTRTFDYDTRNQLTKAARGTEVLTYTYDKVGNLKTLTTPTGTATYTYDAAHRLTSLADAYGGTTTFGHDDNDRRTTTSFPGGAVQTTGYDNSGRHTSITVAKSGAQLLKATYRYTRSNGTDTDKTQSKTTSSVNKITVTHDYTYDALGRLTKAGNRTYGLDNASNVLTGEGNTYTVNAADQYTKVNNTTVSFDGAGNLKSTANPDTSFTYSPTNQVLTGDAGTTKVLDLAYDTSDQTQPRTITETPNGGTATTHVFTRSALGVSETVDNGQRSSYTRDTKGLLIGLKDAAGARYGAVTDHQGTVLALVDTSGTLAAEYDYSAYGTVTASGAAAASNPFRFLGGYQLQRGQQLLGFRLYDSATARFHSPDPTGQEPNPYNYAQADPINNSDPTGATTLGGISELTKAVGYAVVAGAAVGVGCTATAAVGCVAGIGAGIVAFGSGLKAVNDAYKEFHE
ncbi:RHS repeat-associated core domain-containing protein [Actinosynnema sp. NPDC050436]|uniref:RHS repeat-associated core domain-containing protein n=1 Tax=Actinosynnema sp. NPDC050436 TaxID=3155659 RepID=UPI0033C8C37D